ncbi:MAG: DNA mismatch repair endonuclease MutH [Deltaproteobacteria bacterium]|nr:DNA mismatch repair endonuclease MutH [Deltaproteobacteria bacterium]
MPSSSPPPARRRASRPPPPVDEAELRRRAAELDGSTVGELARALGVLLPAEARRAKGAIGALVERALGATAGSRALPDFPHLGIELKTIPLDREGRVRESTFVCTVDLLEADREEWLASRVRRKLGCVLWMPVEAARVAPLPERHFGTPRLWRPDPEEEALLAADWHEAMSLIVLGQVERLDGYRGRALQVRPKAATGEVRVEVLSTHAEAVSTVPRGFYLRARFTEALLWR